MNRDELDVFFARADDVLSNWHGGPDSMHARVPGNSSDELPALVDSYYDDGAADVMQFAHTLTLHAAGFNQAVLRLQQQMTAMGQAFAQIRLNLPLPKVPAIPTGPADQRRVTALNARRSRNTGPVSRRGLDGHYR